MGYYTKYWLTVKGENGYDIYEHLLEDNDEFRYSVDSVSCKWYNHEEDIKDFKEINAFFLLKKISVINNQSQNRNR